ncbi:hypothetical protein RP20_CCG018679 [Aedes albopictus]|nr:A-agglutinin anchorage subunit-like [Aedes albopictus]KXJ72166.1 hypothetical protein RP20_CCG018679 [Aedes albopictus]
MFARIVTIAACLSTLATAGPVPNHEINPIIANIDSYFGNLAQSLVFRREVNSTEKYQSADGHTQVVIQPASTTTLQEILFHPTNQHLVTENETEVFSNGTNKVLLAKVDLVTEATTENTKTSESQTSSLAFAATSPAEVAPKLPLSTSIIQVLKAIPSTVVAGTTESSTLADLSTKAISSTATTVVTSGSTTLSTPNSTPHVAIVTPVVSEVAVTASSSSTTTAEPESESKEIRDKVKEVEAEPVILTVGV